MPSWEEPSIELLDDNRDKTENVKKYSNHNTSLFKNHKLSKNLPLFPNENTAKVDKTCQTLNFNHKDKTFDKNKFYNTKVHTKRRKLGFEKIKKRYKFNNCNCVPPNIVHFLIKQHSGGVKNDSNNVNIIFKCGKQHDLYNNYVDLINNNSNNKDLCKNLETFFSSNKIVSVEKWKNEISKSNLISITNKKLVDNNNNTTKNNDNDPFDKIEIFNDKDIAVSEAPSLHHIQGSYHLRIIIMIKEEGCMCKTGMEI